MNKNKKLLVVAIIAIFVIYVISDWSNIRSEMNRGYEAGRAAAKE
jgi:hypothetical protein